MRSYIEDIVGKISDESFSLIQEITVQVEITNGDFLLQQNQICRHLWFLYKGAIRVYKIVNGEVRNTHFFMERGFLTNYMSVLTRQPSDLFFQATEDCQLGQISYEKLEFLYSKCHQIEHIGRLMAEIHFIAEYHLRSLLLNMNALERYEFIEKNQPEIFTRFALKDIASYLGITPVSLSRLRKYRAEKK